MGYNILCNIELLTAQLLSMRCKYKPNTKEYRTIMRAVQVLERQEEKISELYKKLNERDE